jgi:hypothetical protein
MMSQSERHATRAYNLRGMRILVVRTAKNRVLSRFLTTAETSNAHRFSHETFFTNATQQPKPARFDASRERLALTGSRIANTLLDAEVSEVARPPFGRSDHLGTH